MPVNETICFVYTYSRSGLMKSLWARQKSDNINRTITITGCNHLRSSAPCLLTSLYRLLWGEHQVHRPHFTGRPSGLGVMGSCKFYRLLLTGPPLQVPS